MPSLSPLALHTVGPQKSLVQLDKGIKSATPLSRLRDISGCLPNMVPLAVPSDPVVGLAGDPREIIAIRELEEPDEHPYEWLNKVLNSICGKFAKWNKILPSAVRQGPLGLPGLCNTLQYFINNKLASEKILEIHINSLIGEAEKCTSPLISSDNARIPEA